MVMHQQSVLHDLININFLVANKTLQQLQVLQASFNNQLITTKQAETG